MARPPSQQLAKWRQGARSHHIGTDGLRLFYSTHAEPEGLRQAHAARRIPQKRSLPGIGFDQCHLKFGT